MIWRRLPKRYRLRRRLKRTALRSLHAFEHHYLSLVSAAVLAIVLALALTSTSFEIEGEGRSEAAAIPVRTLQPATTAGLVQPQGTPVPEPRSVVYYFVSSQEKIDELQHALHRDLVDEALIAYKPLHNVSRIFILVEDHRDEADALELLRQQALTPSDDTIVRVVDLR